MVAFSILGGTEQNKTDFTSILIFGQFFSYNGFVLFGFFSIFLLVFPLGRYSRALFSYSFIFQLVCSHTGT